MQYLTYAEYRAMGGEMAEPAFVRYEFRARKMYIDWATFNRLVNAITVPEAVKHCTFELVERIRHMDAQQAQDVQSANNDGVSVTYKVTDDVSFRRECLSLVGSYLEGYRLDNGVPLTYRGLTANEGGWVTGEMLSAAQVEALINDVNAMKAPAGHEILYVEAE